MLTHDAALPLLGTMQSLYRFRTIRYNFRCLATLLYRYLVYARPFALSAVTLSQNGGNTQHTVPFLLNNLLAGGHGDLCCVLSSITTRRFVLDATFL